MTKVLQTMEKPTRKKHGKLSFVIFQVINEWKIFKKQSLLYYEDY